MVEFPSEDVLLRALVAIFIMRVSVTPLSYLMSMVDVYVTSHLYSQIVIWGMVVIEILIAIGCVYYTVGGLQ